MKSLELTLEEQAAHHEEERTYYAKQVDRVFSKYGSCGAVDWYGGKEAYHARQAFLANTYLRHLRRNQNGANLPTTVGRPGSKAGN